MSFTTVRVDRVIALSGAAGLESARHASTIAKYFCSAAHSSSKDKDE